MVEAWDKNWVQNAGDPIGCPSSLVPVVISGEREDWRWGGACDRMYWRTAWRDLPLGVLSWVIEMSVVVVKSLVLEKFSLIPNVGPCVTIVSRKGMMSSGWSMHVWSSK